MTLACLASVTGGLVGALALLLLAPPLAEVALKFGPVEYFWLAVFGLTLIAALSEGSLLKGLIGAAFGLLLSTIGVAVVGGDVRFTQGSTTLLGGEALALSWAGKFNLLRSSVIGTLVGILPGAGGSIAGLVAYSESRRVARDRSRFGKGAPEGVQATESANNATVRCSYRAYAPVPRCSSRRVPSSTPSSTACWWRPC